MASPGLSNQFTSLRQSLSSASYQGEEIPLSENIRYNRGEGGVVINCEDTNENSSQIPRRQSSSLQPQSEPPNNDSPDEEEGSIYY
jgi:hypothetical protein